MTPTPSGASPKDERATQAEPAGEREAAPCPFCGCHDISTHDCDDDSFIKTLTATCDGCGCTVTSSLDWKPFAKTMDRAGWAFAWKANILSVWNRRAALSTSSTKPGEARADTGAQQADSVLREAYDCVLEQFSSRVSHFTDPECGRVDPEAETDEELERLGQLLRRLELALAALEAPASTSSASLADGAKPRA